ncbi:MAG: DMT family transporter, partial [Oscillospiraceae bacterium]|nr:DMT family transporter [Oscillospiraceae bacterium]
SFALEKYNSLTVTAYTFVFGLVGAFPIINPDETFSIISKNPELIFWCIGIGVVCTILPYLFYTWGLSKMESSKAAIIVAVEPLVGAVMGMTFYNEEKSLTKIIGITLILLAIVLLNIKNKDNKTS